MSEFDVMAGIMAVGWVLAIVAFAVAYFVTVMRLNHSGRSKAALVVAAVPAVLIPLGIIFAVGATI